MSAGAGAQRSRREQRLSAVGQTKGALVQLNLTASTNLRTVEEFRKLVVREQNGSSSACRISPTSCMGADNYNQDVRMSGQRAVFMGVWVLPNANPVNVIGRVNREVQQIRRELPTGMMVGVAYDSTKYIKSAIKEVVTTLAETLLIVMVVIFPSWARCARCSSPWSAIPVSLIGAVFLMQVFGFAVNLLTLLAIILCVGLVVDDAS